MGGSMNPNSPYVPKMKGTRYEGFQNLTKHTRVVLLLILAEYDNLMLARPLMNHLST